MALPISPSLEELRLHVPRITPVKEGVSRPFWSVMIPTYNSGRYLRSTLESVLCQDPGPEKMQIEVVDGCSTTDDPEEVTKELGRGRVGFHRLDSNHGPAHTFNVCIERGLGQWVHILHGDDMVLPGFYDTYEATIRSYPDAQMVVGPHVLIDEGGRWTSHGGPRPPIGRGIIDDFVQQQATWWLVTCPSVTVCRAGYEALGGFCTFFQSVTDWDMWFRLAQYAPVACVDKPYALYRIHSASETQRLFVSATNIREAYFIVTANLARLAASSPAIEKDTWRSKWAEIAESSAWRLDRLNCTEGRYNQALWAWMLDPSMRRLIMVLKSWLKYKFANTDYFAMAQERSTAEVNQHHRSSTFASANKDTDGPI